MKQVAFSCPRWPVMETRMREQLQFWRKKSWRKHIAKCLQRINTQDVDYSCLNDAPPTMAKWRCETIAIATRILKSHRPFILKSYRP